MECVKAGLGREAAHELIKKHSTKSDDFLADLSQENSFPFSKEQLESFIRNPSEFTGNAQSQCSQIQKLIVSKIKGKVPKVSLSDLR
jgi:adenylosuccinate lyase